MFNKITAHSTPTKTSTPRMVARLLGCQPTSPGPAHSSRLVLVNGAPVSQSRGPRISMSSHQLCCLLSGIHLCCQEYLLLVILADPDGPVPAFGPTISPAKWTEQVHPSRRGEMLCSMLLQISRKLKNGRMFLCYKSTVQEF